MIEAKVIAASQAENKKVIWTIQCKYHRFLHGELLTHRVFSRNSMSSRAVPVKVIMAQVWSDPAMPVHWGANQAGMQAKAELTGWKRVAAEVLWRSAAKLAVIYAWGMVKVGLHKQVANRILEPWQWMNTIITSTEWENFFELRDHPDAQPEFQVLAKKIREAMQGEWPVKRLCPGLAPQSHNLHLPYVLSEERETLSVPDLLKISAARCARVSYLTHDNQKPSVEADKKLYERLVGQIPLHASPVEHQAWPAYWDTQRSGNFMGWVQSRHSETVNGNSTSA